MVQQWPMSKQPWVSRSSLANPLLCPSPMSSQAFVFRHRPGCQALVQIAQCWMKCRFVVATIVRNPTTNDRVEHTRQIIYPSIDTTAQLPPANLLTNCLRRCLADARTEVDEELPPTILRPPGLKAVPKEVEFLVQEVSTPVIILAVDDLRLLRMKLQSALGKALLQRISEFLRLLFTDAMAESVVGESLERDVRIMLGHPSIERVMEEQICQQG